jgi:outer membrane protein assembly factor BamB
MPCRVLLLTLATLMAPTWASAADWPGWRGPTGQGQTAETNLPLTWGGKQNTNVIWKCPLAGIEAKASQDQNQSSPIVSRGRVFITASYWPSAKSDPKAIPEHHVACYRATDGKKLWDVTIKPGPWLFTDLRGGYTAPTPAADGERVFVVFGSAVIAALDYDGKLIWRKEITPFKFDVALAASPVLFGETVILQCDQVDKESRLVAFDRKTGAVKWREARPTVRFSHSTPVVATIGGKPRLLISASNALQCADPANGKLIWWCAAKGDTVSPVVGGGLVYCDSGRGGPGFAVDPTGTGDVTKTHLKWTINKVNEGYSSPVVSGGYLYRLQNPEQLKCYRLASGEEVYSERLNGVSTASSPIATADGIIYLTSAGKSYVVKAGPKFDLLATNDLGDGSPAAPAVADGRFYLRGRKWLYCIGTKN